MDSANEQNLAQSQDEQELVQPMSEEELAQALRHGLPLLKQAHQYGYVIDAQAFGCSSEELKRTLNSIGYSRIQYLWTPESENILRPEESDLVFEIYKDGRNKGAKSAIAFGVLMLLLPVGLFLLLRDFSILFQSLLFIIGLAILADGIWQFHETRKLTKEEVAQTIADEREAIGHIINFSATRITYQTYVIAGCIGIMWMAQMYVGINKSVDIAGQYKEAVRQGEFWRLFTASLMHGGIMHIAFNSMALWNVGKAIEQQLHNSYVALVFFFSAFLGSVFSQMIGFGERSIGASGGIIGMIGFLAVAAYTYKEFFPRSYFKMLLQNLALIAFIGIVGFAIIDNAAHLGGLIGGVGLGFLLLKKKGIYPSEPNKFIETLSFICLAAIVFVALFCVWVLLTLPFSIVGFVLP